MRATPVSGDLVVKLAITAICATLGVWAVRRIAARASTVGAAVGNGLQAVNPTNPDNVIYQGANTVFRAVTGNEVDTIGTAMHGVFNPPPSPRLWPSTPSPVYAQPEIGQIGNTDGVNYSYF